MFRGWRRAEWNNCGEDFFFLNDLLLTHHHAQDLLDLQNPRPHETYNI